jgi:hypothetical protein
MKGARRTMIKCSTHGESKWTGEVICIACQAVWHLTDPMKRPADPLGRCKCGKLLTGDTGTARAICPQCFRTKWAAAPTMPPTPN